MNNTNELQELPISFLIIDYGTFVFELLTIFFVLISLIQIFKNSSRPGRTTMLFGYIFSLLSHLPVYFSFFIGAEEGYSGFIASIIFYSQIVSVMFVCIAAFGFILFARSFQNES